MASPTDTDLLMKRYLLGALSDAEREQVEKLYFYSNDQFELLSSIEDELIDDYLDHALSPGDRDLLERNYLTTARTRQKLAAAIALRGAVTKSTEKSWRSFLAAALGRPVRLPQYSIVAAAVAGLIVIIWGASTITDVRNKNNRLRTAAASMEKQIDELRRELRTRLADKFVSVLAVLTPRSDQRGEGQQQLQTVLLAPGTALIRLQLPVKPSARRPFYRAILRDPGGPQFEQNELQRDPQSDVLMWDVPAAGLRSNEYWVLLCPSDANRDECLSTPLLSYPFRLIRQ